MQNSASLSAHMNGQHKQSAGSTTRRKSDNRSLPGQIEDLKAQAKHRADRRRYFADSLKKLFNARTRQKASTNVQITPFLQGAELVWGNTHTDKMPSIDGHVGFTYVIADKRFPGRAVLISYEHHHLETYKHLMEHLNPNHDCRHKLAPTVEYCTDTYTLDGKPSGRLVALSGFDHLDLKKIEQDPRIVGGHREHYLEIVRQLKVIAHGHRKLKQAQSKPGVR